MVATAVAFSDTIPNTMTSDADADVIVVIGVVSNSGVVAAVVAGLSLEPLKLTFLLTLSVLMLLLLL